MTLKVLQLNVWQGAFLPEIIDFVQKNDFDILHFQEVTGGIYSRGGSNTRTDGQKGFVTPMRQDRRGIDSFETLESALTNYSGINVPTWRYAKDKNSYHGIASFVKKNIQVLETKTVWMQPYTEYDYTDEKNIELHPRAAISLHIKIDEIELYAINSHLAWSKSGEDTDRKIAQSKILYKYMKTLDKPILFTGDFNAEPHTKTASQFNEFGISLTEVNHIINTLNPHTHHGKHLFPDGLAVDFIFAPKNSKVKQFKVIDDVDLSDHFGLMAEIEL